MTETVKTRTQGNAIMVTIPKSFNIPAGVKLRPRLTNDSIVFEFVQDDDFFDFSSDILQDLIKEGYSGSELLSQFNNRKKALNRSMDKLIEDAEKTAIPMTRDELEKKIGL